MPLLEDAAKDYAFGLIDTDSGNMVGGFCSEQEALSAVADAVREHGEQSEAVLSLTLFRWDTPPEEGFVADGAELVRRAMATVSASRAHSAASGANGSRESGREKESAAPIGGGSQPA